MEVEGKKERRKGPTKVAYTCSITAEITFFASSGIPSLSISLFETIHLSENSPFRLDLNTVQREGLKKNEYTPA